MICLDIHKSLSAYIDRQLPAWENTEVSRHTQDCSNCQAELQSLIEIKRSLRTGSLPRMPESVRQAILAETVLKSRHEGWLSIRWWVPTLALATAAGGWLFLRAAENYVLKRIPETTIAEHRPHKTFAPSHDIAWHRETGASSSKQTQ